MECTSLPSKDCLFISCCWWSCKGVHVICARTTIVTHVYLLGVFLWFPQNTRWSVEELFWTKIKILSIPKWLLNHNHATSIWPNVLFLDAFMYYIWTAHRITSCLNTVHICGLDKMHIRSLWEFLVWYLSFEHLQVIFSPNNWKVVSFCEQ